LKKKYFIFFVIVCIILILFLQYFIFNHKEVPKLHTDNKQIYYGSEKINLSKLNDPLFTDSEYSYNQDLAISSFNLAVSAFSSNVTDTNWGNSSQSGREDNVRKKLIEYGFSNIHFYDYDKSLNDYSSKAAFAVGSKHYNHDTIIVAVAVRGGNYGLEWADNFNIGNSSNDYHIGFYNAALNIKSTLDKLVIPLAKQKNIKFWITGYSRGGAVAKILATAPPLL